MGVSWQISLAEIAFNLLVLLAACAAYGPIKQSTVRMSRGAASPPGIITGIMFGLASTIALSIPAHLPDGVALGPQIALLALAAPIAGRWAALAAIATVLEGTAAIGASGAGVGASTAASCVAAVAAGFAFDEGSSWLMRRTGGADRDLRYWALPPIAAMATCAVLGIQGLFPTIDAASAPVVLLANMTSISLTGILLLHERRREGRERDLSARVAILAAESKELRAARDVADATALTRAAFLANISHDVRTPLHNVIGLAETLEHRDLGDEEREIVHSIRASGQSMFILLTDIIELSRLEAGRLDIKPKNEMFPSCLRDFCMQYEPIARTKGLSLRVDIDEAGPERMKFDAVRVRQCLSTLLSNAIRFTETGSISVEIRRRRAGASAWLIEAKVTDTGIGMDDLDQKTLFDAAAALGEPPRRAGGARLGLAVARKLSRLMGGDLTVRSALGKGTAMTLSFTAASADLPISSASPIVRPDIEWLSRIRVLIVGANEGNRHVMRLALAPLRPGNVCEASDSAGALGALKACAFDIVLLDETAGGEALKTLVHIRASGAPWSDVPVIAFLERDADAERERAMAFGVSGHAEWPMQRTAFLDELARVLASAATVDAVAEQPVAALYNRKAVA